MPGSKEIRTKITSIKSTQKITRAMEMMAASKMRKAQDRMQASRPYAQKMREVIGHLAAANPEYKHPFMLEREVKRVGYIVVSTDRGLCGGLNANLFRKMMEHGKQFVDSKIDLDFATIGRKGRVFLSRFGANIVANVEDLGDKPKLDSIIGAAKVMMDAYLEEKLDAIYLVFNDFVNTMTQQPTVEKLLPLSASDLPRKYSWDYVYEPDPKFLLDTLMARYVESQIYQACVENVACEQCATMIAMKNATDNAGDLIDELELIYNKSRQAAITKELSEIVSGAAAV